ncbi:hypothetical protein E4U15_002006 [Claviceps sp. LM218 group G6]|nr:hypothetical protein E4U15_002006 [Claviceps sp. LM218 group G6]
MAHVAQSAGPAGDAVPMDIDSGTRGLAQSCHHPLSGLGSINVEAVGTEAITVRERVPKLLIAEYEKMARLVIPPALEGVWEVCLSIFNIGATNPQRHAQNNNTVTTENLEKSIEKAVQKALPREGPHGRPSPREAAPAPLPLQPPRDCIGKWLRKGTSISSTVSGRSPVEIVKAVNAALESEVAVKPRVHAAIHAGRPNSSMRAVSLPW